MTVLEALKKSGWEYCRDEQGEAWEIDQLAADNPKWVQQIGIYSANRDCVVCEDGDELTDNDPELTQKLTSQAAAALGRIKSDKKAASSRENGKKGGRPKTRFHITDTGRAYSYEDGFTSLQSAIEAAAKRPAGLKPYIIADSNGKAYNLDGERIYI